MLLGFFKVSCVLSFILRQNFFPSLWIKSSCLESYHFSSLVSASDDHVNLNRFMTFWFVSCLNRITSCWIVSILFFGLVFCLVELYHCSLIHINLHLSYFDSIKCCLNRINLHSSKFIHLHMFESNQTYYVQIMLLFLRKILHLSLLPIYSYTHTPSNSLNQL